MRSILVIAGFPDSLLNFRGELLSAMQQEGLAVHVAAPDLPADSPLRATLEARGIRVHCIRLRRAGVNPLADMVTFLDIWRLLRAISPDCVFAYTIKPIIYGLLAASLAAISTRVALITGLGYAFAGNAQGLRAVLRRFVRLLYGLSLRGASRIFFQNPDDRDLFRQLGIIDGAAPVTVVNGSGINVSHFMLQPLDGRDMSFLLIARLLGDKGVREYVAAARQIKQAYPQVIFRLVGWIDENPDAIPDAELRTWVSDGTIEFLGRLSDVRPAIADASVYVLPSYREGTPRTVLEAMAMGRPVITTDAPGCRETVVDGYNGFLVPVRSVYALVQAMKRFIERPELVAEMGACSRKLAEEKYDVNAVNATMLGAMGISRVGADVETGV